MDFVGFFLTVSLFISSLFFKPVTAGCTDSDVTEVKWFVSLKVFLLKLAAYPLPVPGFCINLLLSNVALIFVITLG